MYCSADQQLLEFEVSVSGILAFVISPSCVRRGQSTFRYLPGIKVINIPCRCRA
jgi:hypothetical protein